MKFYKMHGLGNDFIFVQGKKDDLPPAVAWCDRRFGIGADGVIVYGKDEECDLFMRIYNSDGSEAMMCGNATRCLGKLAYETGLCRKEEITLQTPGGIKVLELTVQGETVTQVRVNMGVPSLECSAVPVLFEGDRMVEQPMTVDGRMVHATAVSMGNPHCVIFSKGINALNLQSLGPRYEHNPIFPERVNTEWAEIMPDGSIQMRVYERGAGETPACGTGACAVFVAARLTHRVEKETGTVHLLGGDLQMKWGGEGQPVWMEGPAALVYTGEMEESFLHHAKESMQGKGEENYGNL